MEEISCNSMVQNIAYVREAARLLSYVTEKTHSEAKFVHRFPPICIRWRRATEFLPESAPGCVLWISFVARNEESIRSLNDERAPFGSPIVVTHVRSNCAHCLSPLFGFVSVGWQQQRAKRTIVIANYERKIYYTIRIKLVQTSKTVNQGKVWHKTPQRHRTHKTQTCEFGAVPGTQGNVL